MLNDNFYGDTSRSGLMLLAIICAAALGPLSIRLCKRRIQTDIDSDDAPYLRALIPAILATLLGVAATPKLGIMAFILLPASPVVLLLFGTIPFFVAAHRFTSTERSQRKLKECAWVSLLGTLGNAGLLALFAMATH